MSDEGREPATGTTGGATGTAAAAADGSAARAADGSAATLSAEELARKLKEAEDRAAELERQKQQLLSEKTAVERERAAAREAMQRAGSTPPTPAADATPYDSDLRALQQAGQGLMVQLSAAPDDPLLLAQAATTATQIRLMGERRDAWLQEQRFSAMRKELLEVQDTALRTKIAERLESGEFTSVKAAREAVEGTSANAELAEVRKKMAELEAELKRMREIGPVADVAASVLSSGGSSQGVREITIEEWRRLQSGDAATAAKADSDYEEGRIRIRR